MLTCYLFSVLLKTMIDRKDISFLQLRYHHLFIVLSEKKKNTIRAINWRSLPFRFNSVNEVFVLITSLNIFAPSIPIAQSIRFYSSVKQFDIYKELNNQLLNSNFFAGIAFAFNNSHSWQKSVPTPRDHTIASSLSSIGILSSKEEAFSLTFNPSFPYLRWLK